MEYLRPFYYAYRGNFTNHKHRTVTFELPITERYELQAIQLASVSGHELMYKIPELMVDWSIWVGISNVPYPIFPPVLYDPGKLFKCSVRLPDGLDVGRKRPAFIFQLLGNKIVTVDGDGELPMMSGDAEDEYNGPE